jgi:hypothetical protein
MGANSHIVKPISLAERLRIAREIKDWYLKADTKAPVGPAWRKPGPDTK